MDSKIIVVFAPHDSNTDQKRKLILEKFQHSSVSFTQDIKSIYSLPDLEKLNIIIDFDVACYEHIELVEYLKSKIKEGVSFEFLADVIESVEKSELITSGLRKNIDDFVTQLLPLRESLSNIFLNPPLLKFKDLNFMFCHHDEDGLFFFSKIKLESIIQTLRVKIDVKDEHLDIECKGEIESITPFDEDTTRKYFYFYRLDEGSKNKLKSFFQATEELNTLSLEVTDIVNGEGS